MVCAGPTHTHTGSNSWLELQGLNIGILVKERRTRRGKCLLVTVTAASNMTMNPSENQFASEVLAQPAHFGLDASGAPHILYFCRYRYVNTSLKTIVCVA